MQHSYEPNGIEVLGGFLKACLFLALGMIAFGLVCQFVVWLFQ